jgi:polyhydroxyalkanoate synthesis regulator phasin
MNITTFGLISITRKKGAHYIEREGNLEYLTEDVLAICLPFGNNYGECIKLKYFNNQFYLSFTKIISDEEGIGIIGVFSSIKSILNHNATNILKILEILKKRMNYNSFLESKLKTLTLDEFILQKVDNIESVIISILLTKKIFIIDKNLQILSLLHSLINLFPEKFHKMLDFTINSTSYTENINFMSIEYSRDSESLLKYLSSEKYTIIDFENNISFGIYSSPLISTLVKKLRNKNQEEAKFIIEFLLNYIYQKQANFENKTELTKRIKISRADEKLVQQIRMNNINEPIKISVFEELIK